MNPHFFKSLIAAKDPPVKRVFASFGLDFAGAALPIYLFANGQPEIAVGLRVVYNFSVEVIPDALRAIRRKTTTATQTLVV